MSLVNDVLRQLDSASSKPQKALPLHPMVADEPVRKKQIVRIVFSTIVALLLLILLLKTFYKEAITDIFEMTKSAEIKQIEALITQEKKQLEQQTIEQKTVENKVEEQKAIEQKTIEKKAMVEKAELVAAKESPFFNEPKEIEQPKVNKQEQAQVQAPKKKKEQEFQPVKIKTIENPGFKEYQLALRSYKIKQNTSALSWINAAIEKENKDEYLRLKVRILAQQGDGEELHNFVLSNNDITSLEWFQLVAPTLQIFSYYELSNAYYSELIRQQPNEVKWQLATALNFSKLGLNEKTYSIYKNLFNSNLLTNKQKQWVASRLDRMEQGRGVKNES